LAGGDVAALGRALDVNAALLTAIGVSTGELERAVLAARRAGAAGAKPTGSGGGGIVIGVCEATEAAAIADRLRERGFRIVAAGPIVPADPSGIPARTGDAKMDVKERLAAARRDHWGAVRGLLDAVIDDTTPAGSSLGEMCRYHLDTGGKRLRALIPILAAETLGLPPEKARPFGAACEMLHNATLVHDDLQDGDAVRRGRDTVWKKWSAAQAINLGDAMFHWAAALLQRIDAPAETLSELLDLFVRGTIRVIDGQAREFLLKERNAPTAEDYFAVVEGKTSGLFEIPIVGAAILARSPAPLRRALAAAAGDLGVLFQVHDDLIDLYGEKGRARRGGDIAEGKISALVVHALAHAPSAESAWLRATLSKPREETTVEDIDRADRLFREHGSVRFAKEEMARRHRRAVEYPELSGIPALRGLIDGLATLMGSDTII
jgi:geranylgeranyl pyrophosphate synthase